MRTSSGAPVILCIDDEPQLLADIVDELQREGYVAHAATCAAEAYDLAATVCPDLILCDISMPDADGYMILQTLRARQPALYDVPFIFLSALAKPSQIVLGKRLGADDYLTKPIDYDILLATVSARLSQVDRMKTGFASEFDAMRQSMADATLTTARDSFAVAADALDRMAVGLLRVDKDGLLRDRNATAASLLEEADGIASIGSRVVAVSPRSATELRKTMAEFATVPEQVRVMVLTRDFRQSLLLRIAAEQRDSQSSLVVTVIDPERMPALSPDTARQLYGLTPTEAKLAIAIAEGARPDEISSRFSIAQSTINFHLNNVFRKTDTSRQIDMVALLIRTALAES